MMSSMLRKSLSARMAETSRKLKEHELRKAQTENDDRESIRASC